MSHRGCPAEVSLEDPASDLGGKDSEGRREDSPEPTSPGHERAGTDSSPHKRPCTIFPVPGWAQRSHGPRKPLRLAWSSPSRLWGWRGRDRDNQTAGERQWWRPCNPGPDQVRRCSGTHTSFWEIERPPIRMGDTQLMPPPPTRMCSNWTG